MNNFNNIPQELKQLKRWVLWKKRPLENGKFTKIPICAFNGYGAKSNDDTTWADFDLALSKIDYFSCDGLGFMLGNGYFGVDIDHAKDDKELLKEFINTLCSYTETSQSGEGIHIICKGKLPEGNRRKGNIEMYDNARFFVMTGNIIGNLSTINEGSSSIIPLWEKYLNDTPKIANPNAYVFERGSNYSNELKPAELSNQQVLEKAMASRNGDLFSRLYYGQWEGIYTSQSDADLALCDLLAFWCCKNAQQMDFIFRKSGLMRDKWDRKTGSSTYGEITIQKAISNCKDVFTISSNSILNKYDENGVKIESKKHYDLNDTGNANRFIDTYGDDLKYNNENKEWLIWDGKTWVKDNKQYVKNMADELIETMKEEAIQEEQEQIADALLKNVKHLSNTGGKDAMLKEAQHIQNTATINADYDKDKYLLNCENGVVDLITGKILPHDRKYMMSKNTHIVVDMENEPKTWLKCIKDIFKGSDELVNYVHKAIGYSLTGDVKEQCLFQCYGSGSNGKSVFFNTIYSMLGDYVVNAQCETILTKSNRVGGNANPDIARLKGARFVRTNEPDENSRFNEGLVKQLTGGDVITARFLYGGDFEFAPIFKLWIATNYKINIYGTDKGIWRRMRLIPFEACFEGANDDKDIETKLKAELPQILGWAIKGCIKWQKEGLIPPQEVIDATQTYRTEMDIIEKFSNDCLILRAGYREKGVDLFNEYIAWSKRSNEPYKMTQTKFGIEMAKKYQKQKFGGGVYYLGVKLVKHDTSYVYDKGDTQ